MAVRLVTPQQSLLEIPVSEWNQRHLVYLLAECRGELFALVANGEALKWANMADVMRGRVFARPVHVKIWNPEKSVMPAIFALRDSRQADVRVLQDNGPGEPNTIGNPIVDARAIEDWALANKPDWELPPAAPWIGTGNRGQWKKGYAVTTKPRRLIRDADKRVIMEVNQGHPHAGIHYRLALAAPRLHRLALRLSQWPGISDEVRTLITNKLIEMNLPTKGDYPEWRV
jgi:hypothetical protein